MTDKASIVTLERRQLLCHHPDVSDHTLNSIDAEEISSVSNCKQSDLENIEMIYLLTYKPCSTIQHVLRQESKPTNAIEP